MIPRSIAVGLPVLLLLLMRCASANENKAAQAIAQELHARSCELSFGRGASTESGAVRYVELELNDVQGFKQYRSPEFVTSRAALRYFQDLPATETARYDEIRVNAHGDGVSFGKTYRVADLLDVAAAVTLANTYMDRVAHKDMPALDAAYDRAYISDSAGHLLRGLYARIDSAQGPFINHEFVGFGLEAGNNGQVPVVTVLEDAMVRDSVVYNFAVSVDRKSNRIFHLKVE